MTEITGTGKFLKAEQYWYWRFLISDWKKGETESKLETEKFESMAKDIEIMKLRHHIYKAKVKAVVENVSLLEKAYKDYKSALEMDLGVDLNNTVIDDVTFEIKTISKEN